MKTGDKVVCIGGNWNTAYPYPITGEIYRYDGPAILLANYIRLVEFDDMAFASKNFRPVDTTFGPCVCEILEKQIEHDKVLA